MKSAYQAIVTYNGGDYKDLVDKLKLEIIFGKIIGRFDVPTAASIIKYIAYVYSVDSTYILLKESLAATKKRAAEAAGLSKDLYQQVVDLIPKTNPDSDDEYEEQDDVPEMIIKAASAYIHMQEDRDAKNLLSLRELYDEMLRATSKPALTFNELDEKYKCRKMANEIFTWLKEAENNMSVEDANVKAIRQELTIKHRNSATSLRPETAAK